MILTRENRRTRRKTCHSATSSTTNPGFCGEKPATNRLSCVFDSTSGVIIVSSSLHVSLIYCVIISRFDAGFYIPAFVIKTLYKNHFSYKIKTVFVILGPHVCIEQNRFLIVEDSVLRHVGLLLC
jgi:hypothetical protein